jgi:chorismate mutase
MKSTMEFYVSSSREWKSVEAFAPSNEKSEFQSKTVRESEVYSHTMRKASEIGLNPDEIKAIYGKIIAMSVRAENSADKEAHTRLS